MNQDNPQNSEMGQHSQHFVDSDTDETPIEYLQLYVDHQDPSKEEAMCKMLAELGYLAIAISPQLQSFRVVFTSMSMSHPHILFLDEPTSHLDMQNIDPLADGLNDLMEGVVLIMMHS